ncbi:MAG: NAD(P)H-dependent oxidoreductase subunit E [Acholeplasmataceae bacterium]|jgi:NADH:ubiquinone oxidoreductase subunit E
MKELNFTQEQYSTFLERIEEHKKKPGPIMPVLNDAQEIFGCIPLQIQKIIAEKLNVSVSKINGIVTFYAHFSLEPKGKYVIAVCLGTACYVKGSQQILNTAISTLKIQPGETTEDGLFTLEATRCIGACGLAPVFLVGDDVFGISSSKQMIEQIRSIREKEAKENENKK